MTRRSFFVHDQQKPVALKMMTLQILSGLNENNADKNSKVITSSYKNKQSSLKTMSCYPHKRTCTVMYKNSTGIAHIFFLEMVFTMNTTCSQHCFPRKQFLSAFATW